MAFVSKIRRLVLSKNEVAPNTYQLTIGGVNVVLIVEDRITMIDAGLLGSAPHVLEFIEQLGRSPRELERIILTHRHVDHIGGLAALKKSTPAKVAIHPADISDGEAPPPRPGVKHRLLHLPGAETIRSVFGVFEKDIDIKLSDGEVLDVLGGLHVVHTPGHTPGSVCLYAPAHKLLVCGDAVRKRRNAFMLPPKTIAGFNREQAVASVRRLLELDIETVCAGHGLPVTSGARGMLEDLLARSQE